LIYHIVRPHTSQSFITISHAVECMVMLSVRNDQSYKVYIRPHRCINNVSFPEFDSDVQFHQHKPEQRCGINFSILHAGTHEKYSTKWSMWGSNSIYRKLFRNPLY